MRGARLEHGRGCRAATSRCFCPHRRPRGARRRLRAFRVGGTFYQLGNRSGAADPRGVVPPRRSSCEGVDFPHRRDPEAMLAFVYGPRWRVPDPSFSTPTRPTAYAASTAGCAASAPTAALEPVLPLPEPASAAARRSTFAAGRRRIAAGAPVADLGSRQRARLAVLRRARPRGPVVRLLARRPGSAPAGRCAARACPPTYGCLLLNELRTVLAEGLRLRGYTSTPGSCSTASTTTPAATLAAGPARRGEVFLEFPTAGPGRPPAGPAARTRRRRSSPMHWPPVAGCWRARTSSAPESSPDNVMADRAPGGLCIASSVPYSHSPPLRQWP